MRLSQLSTLFVEFIRILNEAREQHGPYPLFDTLAAVPSTKEDVIPVAVYAGEPDVAVDHFKVRYENGFFKVVERGQSQAPAMWEIPQGYIEQVVQNQEKYLNNPGHFDVLCMSIAPTKPGSDEKQS